MSTTKLRASAAEWRPPAGGFSHTPNEFQLPQSPGQFDPPSQSINYESSDGMPTPPLGFKPNYADGEEMDSESDEYGGEGTGGGVRGAPGELLEGEEGHVDWDQQLAQARYDYQAPSSSLYHGIQKENGEIDVAEMYRQMRRMQHEQIEQQIAEESNYHTAIEEKRMKEKEEKMKVTPLTVNGNKRWPKKKLSHFKQQQIAAKKSGFESFSQALLNGSSPFMPPLRQRCGTSLPHIKVDQRFGKRGQPHTAVMQFIVAPIVSNYRPTSFHEVTPGDLMEYHYDFSLLLKAIPTASSIALSFGVEWKPFAIPYCFLNCREYRNEVLSLCPNEVPNAKADAVYEDDIVKDVTQLILAVPELSMLKRNSIAKAMSKRMNLTPMYHVFHSLFEPLQNYQIQIRDLHKTPSTFLLKTSENVLIDIPRPIVIAGDADLWEELPNVGSTFASTGRAAVPQAVATAQQPQPPPQHDETTSANVSATNHTLAAEKPNLAVPVVTQQPAASHQSAAAPAEDAESEEEEDEEEPVESPPPKRPAAASSHSAKGHHRTAKKPSSSVDPMILSLALSGALIAVSAVAIVFIRSRRD